MRSSPIVTAPPSPTSPRPLRFGVQLKSAFPTRAELLDLLHRAEAYGYSVVTVPDHFTEQLAPLTALATAAATSTLRVGTLVLAADYRHPLALAKELATLDVLSEGRLEIGLGAGWMVSDYERAGMKLDRTPVRIDRLGEAVAVLKGAFGPGEFSFDGEHFQITGALGLPKPLQQPHPPILIGGGGPRMLECAARHADIVGVNVNLSGGSVRDAVSVEGSAEAVDRKVAAILESAGTRAGDIELHIYPVHVRVSEERGAALGDDRIRLSSDELAATPFVLTGSVSGVCEDLLAYRERWGFSYYTIDDRSMEEFRPVVERLAGR
jgi:probable F420-dependent oxidoreductase